MFFVVPLLAGAGDIRLLGKGLSGPESLNFHPSFRREPYLQNYAGRTDTFRRDHDLQSEPWVGTPPTLGEVTRLAVFRDAEGDEHVLFVLDGVLCEAYGNSYRELYTFEGAAHEDRYYPWVEVAEGKVYIANVGDPVLVYDGEVVTPLGVLEVPLPPDLRTSAAPMTNFDDGVADSPGTWQWVGHHWTQEQPPSGPTDNVGADGTTRVYGYYEVVCQFVDRFGNKGRVSPPSLLVGVKPRYALDAGDKDPHGRDYLYYDLTPPLTDVHVDSVIVGRTLNQNPDGGVGAPGAYHKEQTFNGTCGLRGVCQLSDGQLALLSPIDTTVMPPPSCSGIAIIGGRAWIWGGTDPTAVYYSDLGFYGQFRLTQVYGARSAVTRVIGAGDRVVIIGESSTEVLYESEAGPTRLFQSTSRGSLQGRSFVSRADRIFGLWTTGFAYFNGRDWEDVQAPYWIESLYTDPSRQFSSALDWNKFYLVTVRVQFVESAANRLLMHDPETGGWFLLEESVYDLVEWQGELLGGDDSIYHLFTGTGKQGLIQIPSYVPEGQSPIQQRTLRGVKFLAEPSGIDDLELTISAFPRRELSTTVQGSMMPSQSVVDRQNQPLPYYDQPALRYDASVKWSGDEDCWLEPVMTKPVTGYQHELYVLFPEDHLIRLRALALHFDDAPRETNL